MRSHGRLNSNFNKSPNCVDSGILFDEKSGGILDPNLKEELLLDDYV